MTQTIVALFDTTAEAEQAMQYVIMSIGGVQAQVYHSDRVGDVSSLSICRGDMAAIHERIRRGGAVVVAKVEDERFDGAIAVLQASGAIVVNET